MTNIFSNMEIEGKQIFHVVIDVCCLAVVTMPTIVLLIANFEPFHRGFYCDDESIMFAYKKDTISMWTVVTVGLLLPTIHVIIIEGIRLKVFEKGSLLNGSFQSYVSILYREIGSFLFGASATQLTSDIARYLLGKLRPHFLSVCKPNINCTSTLGYIGRDVCTGTDTEAIREARLSFPSCHSSFITYTLVYLMIYLQARLRWRKSWLLRPFIQLILLQMAFYTCLSRIFDYWHHWSDVLGGALIGILVALTTTLLISDLITGSKHGQNSNSNNTYECLPPYTLQDDDGSSVGTSTESTSSGPTHYNITQPNNP